MKALFLVTFATAVLPSLSSAAIVGNTFTGVTTEDFRFPESLAAEYPVGTKWTLQVQWDTAAASSFVSDTQSQYPLTKLTLTLQGKSGAWTTSSKAGEASVGLNKLGSNHSIQFTSGWGPTDHTNGTIGTFQPYSINLTLEDPTRTAIGSLATAPGAIDLSKWNPATSGFKMYLNNDGNQLIPGSINFDTGTPDISIGYDGKTDLKNGKVTVAFKKTVVGKKSKAEKVTVRNAGKKDLVLKSLKISGKAKKEFTLATPSKTTLKTGESVSLKLTFKPAKKGTRKAQLTIASDDPKDGSFAINLSGKAEAAAKGVLLAP